MVRIAATTASVMSIMSTPSAAMAKESGGYLAAGQAPDLTRILPGPPAPGTPRANADAQVFRDTRRLLGTARWDLATADVSSDLGARFAEALGFRPDWGRLPLTRALIARFDADRSAAVGAAKAHWQSPRPFIGTDLPICEPRTAGLVANGDYPSGHTAHGWGFALLMAELIPGRAQQILERGRTYGESRYICGSHTQSAVEGGYIAASALMAREQADPLFRRDMAAAADELAAYRRGLTSPSPR
ncbi:acid phosphatase (class A) [Sphingomonas sp. SORGH_AS802]|uniref:acid phosphatase n=1 Tax=unclassified Sphingomonas TaxID=196159 RepID=UPI0028619B5C|nr:MULTISPECIES: phosphatase PAP2 family protein [unclassified Sphingomonas]MDR6125684.1 acid phosphatase (class A) [Sphingomonas sp. SORGH_AS_0438]MDR6134293.1 acid phosphatase (class A) [Sphingomonas sp. SORGH_AS_0802]